jgi:hypothetical protein
MNAHPSFEPSLWLLGVSLLGPLATFAASTGDNFDDNVVSPSRWGRDQTFGRGVLLEKNHRLEYTCSAPSLTEDGSNRPWVLTRFPYNGDWEVQVDVFDNSIPSQAFQVNSAGIIIYSPHSADTDVYMELYSTGFGLPFSTTGFHTEMEIDGDDVGIGDSGVTGDTNGAVRLRWDSTNHVLTAYYDQDVSDGYDWVELASFGLAGSGGVTGNGNWGMTDADQFFLQLYGYSAGMVVSSGQMYLDNFKETGGVTPNGQPPPEPTGKFQFKFPTNNPLLTAIMNLTGNYTGVTPLLVSNDHARTYSVDVAQDESGKLVAMGAMDGVANATGGSELSGSVGSVATVNDKPTVQLTSSFKGTGDGFPVTANASGATPVELVDVGGGSNVVAVTANIAAKAAGIPFRLKQMPVLVPANSTFQNNPKKDWNVDLDLSRKVIKGKERTVASAQLVLPNGDTIAFPEKVVRYSATKGYSLSFKRGTNITANPTRMDKKSSISIQRLLFVQQDGGWEPTGGAVTYRFLGQKGSGNLTDFLAP